MRIGLAEEFVDEARDRNADREHADEEAGTIAGAGIPEQRQQDRDHQRAFERRLIELARVPREAERIGREHHRPAHIGGAAIQFAVHEIGEPAEHHPERHVDRDIIAHAQPVQPAAPGDPGDRDQHADDTAMEAHPPGPQFEQSEAAEQVRLVERGIAQPPAQDDPQRAVEKQIVHMALRHRRARALHHFRQMPISQKDTGEIRQAVPAQREESEIDPGREAELRPLDRVRARIRE